MKLVVILPRRLFRRPLDADDIFLSYSREDGETYLNGLAEALTTRGFACFDDRSGTDAGRLPPETLFRRIRACRTLVLLATPGAITNSRFIAQEVRAFVRAQGTMRVVPIGFDAGSQAPDDWSSAEWFEFVSGKSRSRELAAAIEHGTPSLSVVSRIEKQSNYQKSKDRLRAYRNRAAAAFVVLLLLGLVAGGFALHSVNQVRRSAGQLESNALVVESQQLLRQGPEQLPNSVDFARRAVRRAASVGINSAEANAALRASLALFPHLRDSYTIAKGPGLAERVGSLALSPDGTHFGFVDSDKTVHVYDAVTKAQVAAFPCSCTDIALSSGAQHVAVLGESSFTVVRMRDRGQQRRLPLSYPVSVVALSPGGRYLAVSGEVQRPDGFPSVVSLIDTSTGRIVKRVTAGHDGVGSGDLAMMVSDLSFGPTGDLAIGGGRDSYNERDIGVALDGGPELKGIIVFYRLGLNTPGSNTPSSPERALLENDIGIEFFRQQEDVSVIAPGPDDASFATERGVYERQGLDFAPRARHSYPLPHRRSATVDKVAFSTDASTVVLLKTLSDDRGDHAHSEIVLERWDASGYRGVARTSLTVKELLEAADTRLDALGRAGRLATP